MYARSFEKYIAMLMVERDQHVALVARDPKYEPYVPHRYITAYHVWCHFCGPMKSGALNIFVNVSVMYNTTKCIQL